MDDYIKRKKKQDANRIANDANSTAGKTQTLAQIVARQSGQQMQDLACKIEYIEQRISRLKNTLRQIGIKANSLLPVLGAVLGNPPMQRSQVKNQLLDGETSLSNQVFHQTGMLERSPSMAAEGDVQSTKRQNPYVADEKLPQPGKKLGLGRKIRKKV